MNRNVFATAPWLIGLSRGWSWWAEVSTLASDPTRSWLENSPKTPRRPAVDRRVGPSQSMVVTK